MTVTSEPPGATVVVYPTMERFSTPAEIEVRRKGHYTLRVLRDGYAPEAIFLDRLYNEERAILDAFVSMLPTAGLGPFVDMATGALLEQLPEDTHLVLEPVPESP